MSHNLRGFSFFFGANKGVDTREADNHTFQFQTYLRNNKKCVFMSSVLNEINLYSQLTSYFNCRKPNWSNLECLKRSLRSGFCGCLAKVGSSWSPGSRQTQTLAHSPADQCFLFENLYVGGNSISSALRNL